MKNENSTFIFHGNLRKNVAVRSLAGIHHLSALSIPTMHLRLLAILTAHLFTGLACADTATLFHNPATPQHSFAAGEIRSALEAKKHRVEIKYLAALNHNTVGKTIVITLATSI